jgi:hypothetical protein
MPCVAETVAAPAIQKLYHYDKFVEEHLRDLLSNQRIHLSNPVGFNDPWDCHVCFDMRRSVDPLYRRYLADSFSKQRDLRIPAHEVERIDRDLRESEPFFIEMIQQRLSRLVRREVISGWRLYCLTPYPDNSLMWSHYADRHKGICLEFDAKQMQSLHVHTVSYDESPPGMDPLALLSGNVSPENVARIFLTKSRDWSYESEYRLIARAGEAGVVSQASIPTTKDDYLTLGPGVLTAVIAGCRITDEDLGRIRELVQEHAPGVSVKRAVQAVDRYSLSVLPA